MNAENPVQIDLFGVSGYVRASTMDCCHTR